MRHAHRLWSWPARGRLPNRPTTRRCSHWQHYATAGPVQLALSQARLSQPHLLSTRGLLDVASLTGFRRVASLTGSALVRPRLMLRDGAGVQRPGLGTYFASWAHPERAGCARHTTRCWTSLRCGSASPRDVLGPCAPQLLMHGPKKL